MRVLVVGDSHGETLALCQSLAWGGHKAVATSEHGFLTRTDAQFDLVLVAATASSSVVRLFGRAAEFELRCPVVFLPRTDKPISDWLQSLQEITKPKGGWMEVGDLTIDLLNTEVRRSGRRLQLTKSEFDLLVVLAANQGRTLSRQEIQIQMWGDETRSPNAVDAHVTNLRRKVDLPFSRPLIRTVFGVGYVMVGPDLAAGGI